MMDEDNLSSQKSYIARLHNTTAVQITGDDAQEFLSNQLSSDIQNLTPNQLAHSSWCDPKGRVLFLLLVAKTEDGFYCFVTTDLAEQFCKRLQMFVLRSAVKIEHMNESTVLGLQNATKMPEQLTSIFFYPNRQSSTTVRCLSLVKTVDGDNIIDSLGLPEDNDMWQHDEITLGHPQLSSDASGAFLPQNLNLDALDGISFTKGCYPGQEIIARLKYRGKVKQRLGLLVSTTDKENVQAILSMQAVFAADNPDKKIGTTLYAQQAGEKQFVSAVLEVEFLHNDSQVCIEGTSNTYSVSPPPYEIEI